jgi:hypothetical protein
MAQEERQKGASRPTAHSDREMANDDPSTHGTGTDTGPDHSERAWGGDQDIDTAGMVPGNKATEDDEPKGF